MFAPQLPQYITAEEWKNNVQIKDNNTYLTNAKIGYNYKAAVKVLSILVEESSLYTSCVTIWIYSVFCRHFVNMIKLCKKRLTKRYISYIIY